MGSQDRDRANLTALGHLTGSEPQLVDVAPAGEVVLGMTTHTILTSGAPLDWEAYEGGQRRAVLFGAVYEGIAADPEEAEAMIRRGEIQVRSTQELNCIGSVAGILTASMPVFVVRDETSGAVGFCNLYEGEDPHRLCYGSYNRGVADRLDWLRDVMAPVLSEAIHRRGPLPLKGLMARALRMGDELHSRNTAATMLLTTELMPSFLDMMGSSSSPSQLLEVIDFLRRNEYSFLRVGMAAAKATADSAHGVEGSSLVTAMAINSREFAIRVSGLGDTWFRGMHPELEGKFFDGFDQDDAEWIGGESCVTEVVGLGGFAQACAPTLQAYQGGTFEAMRRSNESMYAITVGEHPDFRIPVLEFRGTPVGIDIFAVVQSGITPVIDGGLAGKDGGQIGAGVLRPHLDVFELATKAYVERYGS
ncbi:DUF1116 domain-containing protein [Nocardioides houyundeii]|uniref:DUF1116 domain-containing protein n=1 Tax=Nocardioides houyundeii TaxID=2045452 RepID=UPI000C75A00A|nr:DUF1116 domain-containing protein [Nocardioides houyundeii]